MSDFLLPLSWAAKRALKASLSGFLLMLMLMLAACSLSQGNPAPKIEPLKLETLTPATPASSNACEQASPINPMQMAKPGIGGTGIEIAKPGIGGTGVDNGGMGGTGIVGVITGFASICVNGVEVHYEPDTPVDSNGLVRSTSDLALGQVVLVQAQGQGAQLQARSITALQAVVGPVQSIDRTERSFTVLGQKVTPDNDINWSSLKVGQWVQVSGPRLANGQIMAGSFQMIPQQGTVSLSGRISSLESSSLQVEGIAVSGDLVQQLHQKTLAPESMKVGAEITISGRLKQTPAAAASTSLEIQAENIELAPTQTRLSANQRVLVQGYVQSWNEREVNLGHSLIKLNPMVQIRSDAPPQTATPQLAINQRVLISARMDAQQRITADQIKVLSSGSSSGSGKNDKLNVDSSTNNNQPASTTNKGRLNSGSGSGSGNADNTTQDDSSSPRGSSNSGSGSNNSGPNNSGSNSGARSPGDTSGSSNSPSNTPSSGSGSGSGNNSGSNSGSGSSNSGSNSGSGSGSNSGSGSGRNRGR